MMRRVMLVAVALSSLVIPEADAAAYIDGNKLLDECENVPSEFLKGTCYGYVVGVQDAVDGLHWFCVPEGSNGVVAKQLVDVVKVYLRDHPERRHYSASSLVTEALEEKFPCH
jgi:Rap1a immunity proteins